MALKQKIKKTGFYPAS